MKTVWRVFGYFKRYPWMAAGTMSCAILGTLMVIVFPGVTKWIIDDVVRQHHPEKLMPLVLFALVAFLLQHGFNMLRIILNNTFEQKVIFDLRSDLYSHIQLLPLRWFDNRATGDLMTRVIEDVNSVERVLIDGIEQGVVAVLQIAIVVAVMFYWNATLAVLVLGFGSHAVLTGSLQLGDLVAMLMLTAFLYDPISRLHQLNQLVQAGRAAGERVFEILDEDAEPGVVSAIVDRAAGITDRGYSPRVIGDIRFENVSFSYAEGLPALRRISLLASPG